MIDWEGLLKFSLKYQDGTNQSNFKEMSESDKKWLQEAMEHYSNSEIKRIQSLLVSLENFKDTPEEAVLAQLEQLQELLDSLDKGSTLYKLGGHIVILRIIFYCKSADCRQIALQIYSSANQNDARVQNESISTGALEMVELLKKEEEKKVRVALFSAISATVRGENLQAKRIFIKIGGLELMQAELQRDPEFQRMVHKVYVLWRDLLYYDDRLHLTFNDLSEFNNTAGLTVKQDKEYDLKYDPNQEEREKNELPQNAQFRGCIRQFMNKNKQLLEGYLRWLKDQMENEKA